MAASDEWNYNDTSFNSPDNPYHYHNREHLADVRIVKKDTIYVIGLSPSIAKPEVILDLALDA